MKKHFILASILLFGKITMAQFYAGADAGIAYPAGNLNSQVNFGYGTKLNLGYSLSDKVDLSLSYQILDFKTMQPDFKILSETISLKYKFSLNNCQPYLGVKTGLYHIKVKVPASVIGPVLKTSNKKENTFGFAPIAGILINTGISDNWKIDISTDYSILYRKNSYQYLSAIMGLLYFF